MTPADMLRVAIKDHFRKGLPYAQALHAAGHEIVREGPADVLLTDLDAPKFGYRPLIDRFKEQGAKVLMYPHGAGTLLVHDNLYEPYEHVDANLVIGPGQAELARRMEYPAATHVTGWALCPIAPFRAATEVRHVLFAPIHAANGYMSETERELNADAFAKLLEGPWRLTVRHLGTIEENALWPADGVEFVTGGMNQGYGECDAADVVVAGWGTLPSLAIARGTPTVVYGQDLVPSYGIPGEEKIPLRRADRYLDFVRYPFDVADGPLDELVHAAARSEAPIAEWKRRFIGEPLDPARLAALIERIVLEPEAPPAIDDTQSFTVAGFADEMLERPELLAAYARAFGPDDAATLVLWGVGLEPDALLEVAQRALDASGVDQARLPDILLLPLPGSAAVDRALADRADALLSEWPAAGRIGALPRYGAAELAAA